MRFYVRHPSHSPGIVRTKKVRIQQRSLVRTDPRRDEDTRKDCEECLQERTGSSVNGPRLKIDHCIYLPSGWLSMTLGLTEVEAKARY